MPKNVMKMLKPSPTHGRNDFDLSHRTLFTANYGELIPGMTVETVPGSKIKVRISDLVRAQPMVTSPFVRAKQHCDVWFVPYNLMWSRFNEFIADKDEPSSSALKNRLFCPHFSISDLLYVLNSWHTSSSVKDIHGDAIMANVCRNLDVLGYPGTYLQNLNLQGSSLPKEYMPNLWRLAAYNLIWYREYRQQYYDDGKYLLPGSISALSNGASYLFNFDWLDCSSEATANLSTQARDVLQAMIQPRYRCWKKDLFTGLMPSTQFGNVSTVDNSLPKSVYLQPYSSEIGGTLSVDANNVLTANSQAWWNLMPTSGFQSSNFDILALRKSEAIQRWRENALRAGNQIEDNFEAHYGVKPKSHLNVHPQFVASFDAPLNIGDINAQAQTGQASNGLLGDVAGKGIMSFDGNSEFTFETNDFGVLMAIYSILPEAEYNAIGIDRMNCLLERQDYFFPEYENLGLEAVDQCNFNIQTSTNAVLGYAPRYFGYKQKLDKVCGQFMHYPDIPSSTDFNGSYRQWCSPKYDVSQISGGTMSLSRLYVNPSLFDVNFNVGINAANQFIVDFYCDVDAIQPMSVSGMPGY